MAQTNSNLFKQQGGGYVYTGAVQLQYYGAEDWACLFNKPAVVFPQGHWCNYLFYHFNFSFNDTFGKNPLLVYQQLRVYS